MGANEVIRAAGVVALVLGLGFLLAPANTNVEPLSLPESPGVSSLPPGGRADADSLTEDIILYNLFSPTRTAPSRRYSATASGQDPDPSGMSPETNTNPSSMAGFAPELIGTAVSERPGETKALLRLLSTDPTPRLYAVGDRAGGYSVVSIDPRSVVLAGPRGRVVLRLPEDEESHS